MLSYSSSSSNSNSSNSSNISSSNSNSNSNNNNSSSSNSTSNCLDPMLLFCYCWVLMQCDVCSVRALSRYCGRRDRPMCFCSNTVIFYFVLLLLIQCIALQCNVCSFEKKLLQQGLSGSNIVLLQNNVCSVLECWAGSNVVMFLLQCYGSVSVSVAVLHCCPV